MFFIHSDFGHIGPFRWMNTSAVPSSPGTAFVFWGGCGFGDDSPFQFPLELAVYVDGARFKY